MSLALVTDVMSGIQSGQMGMAQARQTFTRLFDVMCWEFLDDRRKDSLNRSADDILMRLKSGQIGYDRACRDITALVEAAVRRDFQRFDDLCAPAVHAGIHVN